MDIEIEVARLLAVEAQRETTEEEEVRAWSMARIAYYREIIGISDELALLLSVNTGLIIISMYRNGENLEGIRVASRDDAYIVACDIVEESVKVYRCKK